MSEPHTTLDVNTKEDFLLVKHLEAVGEAADGLGAGAVWATL